MCLRDAFGRLGPADLIEKVEGLVRGLLAGRSTGELSGEAHSSTPFLARIDSAVGSEGESCRWLQVSDLEAVWYEHASSNNGIVLTEGAPGSGGYAPPPSIVASTSGVRLPAVVVTFKELHVPSAASDYTPERTCSKSAGAIASGGGKGAGDSSLQHLGATARTLLLGGKARWGMLKAVAAAAGAQGPKLQRPSAAAAALSSVHSGDNKAVGRRAVFFDSMLSMPATAAASTVPSMGVSRTSAAAGAAAGDAEATSGQQPQDASDQQQQEPQLLHAAAVQDDGGAWQRMGMVMSALEPIVTAFSPCGNSVFFQNASSLAYYGPRPVQAASVSAVAAATTRAAVGTAVHNPTSPDRPSGLMQLFTLEPLKLERLMAEVSTEGRIWKGIVQVPASCSKASAKFAQSASSVCVGSNLLMFGSSSGQAAMATAQQQPSQDCWLKQVKQVLEQPEKVSGIAAGSRSPSRPPYVEVVASPGQVTTGDFVVPAMTPDDAYNRLSSLLNTPDESTAVADDSCNATAADVVGLDVDPLATSTWGLMLDTTEHRAAMGSTANQRSSVRVLQQQHGQQQQQQRQQQPVRTEDPTAIILSSTAGGVLTTEAVGTSLSAGGQAQLQPQLSSSPHLSPWSSAPKGHVGSAPYSVQQQQQQVEEPQQLLLQQLKQPSCEPAGDGLLYMSGVYPGAAAPYPSAKSPQGGVGHPPQIPRMSGFFWRQSSSRKAGNVAAGHGPTLNDGGSSMASSSVGGLDLVRRTASVCAQGVHPLLPPGVAGGKVSRGEMSLPVAARPSTSRVLTFASSLRNTPAMLQHAIMAANASSIGSMSGHSGPAASSSRQSRKPHTSTHRDSSVGDALHNLRTEWSSVGNPLNTTRDMLQPDTSLLEVVQQARASLIRSAPMAQQAQVQDAGAPPSANPADQAPPLSGPGDDLTLAMERLSHSSDAAHGNVQCSQKVVAPAAPVSLTGAASSRGPALGTTTPVGSSTAAASVHRPSASRSWCVHSWQRKENLAWRGEKQFVSGPQVAVPIKRAAAGPVTFPTATAGSIGGESARILDHATLDHATAGGTSSTGPQQQLLPMQGLSRQPQESGVCWHEVTATRAIDPLTGSTAIVVTQTDVTAKICVEKHLAFVAEAEHRLLEQIFPRHVLAHMTEEGGMLSPPPNHIRPTSASASPPVRDVSKLATLHPEVTLLFADIQGFTPMCQTLEPQVVMTFLNNLFTRFDRRLDEFGVYKVETIGDCYFVAGGLIEADDMGMPAVRAARESRCDPRHAESVLLFAKAMLAAAAQVRLPTTGGPVNMRIGIHSGPVVSGVVGERMPRFCLFGDTVNTASRMESSGVPGCIHVSEAACRLLPHEDWVPTGGIEVKGKGRMLTYLLSPGNKAAAVEAAARMAATGSTVPAVHNSKGIGGGSGSAGSGAGGAPNRPPTSAAAAGSTAWSRRSIDASRAGAVRSGGNVGSGSGPVASFGSGCRLPAGRGPLGSAGGFAHVPVLASSSKGRASSGGESKFAAADSVHGLALMLLGGK